MRIGQLSKLTGVSRDALRFYEERGLIRSIRRANGYRDYDEETVDLVGLIRTAQRLGFSLEEVGSHLPAIWTAADRHVAVATLLREKIVLLDERMADLARLRDELLARLQMVCPIRSRRAPGGGA